MNKLKNFVLHNCMILLSKLVKIKSNRVIFISFSGQAYSDNPKAISDYLHKVYGEKFHLVWVYTSEKKQSFPEYITVIRNSIQIFYYLCTSKVWVSNFEIYKWAYKSQKQFYIQTWHGDIPFKKILKDSIPNYPVFESTGMNLLMVGSDYGEKVLRSAFGYSGQITNFGCPRNDILLSKPRSVISDMRKMYGLSDDIKVLLFAPTYRKKNKKSRQKINVDLNRIKNILEKSTNNKWVVLIRSHKANSDFGFAPSDNTFINVTSHPDMNDILLITDILLTDYSSCAADFALTGNLVILLQDDYQDYQNEERGFYFDMGQSPYYRFMDADSLYSFISGYKEIDYRNNCEEILRFHGSKETGYAAEKISQIIYTKCLYKL